MNRIREFVAIELAALKETRDAVKSKSTASKYTLAIKELEVVLFEIDAIEEATMRDASKALDGVEIEELSSLYMEKVTARQEQLLKKEKTK